MTDVVKRVGAVGAGGVGWLAGLPPGVVVCLVLAALLVQYMVAREATHRETIRWNGAAQVYKAGGDGAAVARGLHGRDADPRSVVTADGPNASDSPTAPPGQ